MDPGSETLTIDQDYSGSDPEECEIDDDCPGLYNICGNDGHCHSIVDPDDGFVPKMDQDYSSCGGNSDCLPAGVCINGECQILQDPDPSVLQRMDVDYYSVLGPTETCLIDTDCLPHGVCIKGKCQVVQDPYPYPGFMPRMSREDQDYSGSDPQECETDDDCPGLYYICGNDGHCRFDGSILAGFMPKMSREDQDYIRPCYTDRDCPGSSICQERRCI